MNTIAVKSSKDKIVVTFDKTESNVDILLRFLERLEIEQSAKNTDFSKDIVKNPAAETAGRQSQNSNSLSYSISFSPIVLNTSELRQRPQGVLIMKIAEEIKTTWWQANKKRLLKRKINESSN